MSALSNWREEFNLSEVVTGKMTDTKALQKVSEKSGINNKVTINPKLDEAVKEIGGEVIGMVEQDTTAQKQRIDMKQMILDRQKLKLRRKDLSAAKKEKKEGEEGESTNAMKQANVIAQEEVVDIKKENEKKRKNALQIQKVIGEGDWIQKATKNMRKDKPCTGEKFGSESCPPGSKRYNLAKTFRKMAKEETEVNEGVMKMVKKVMSKKKPEKKKATMDDITSKVHDWRQKNSKEQQDREKYVSFTRPIVKEEVVTEADPRLAIYQSGMTDASRVKGPVGKTVDKVKDKVKKVLGKKDKVSSHLDRYRFQSGLDNYLKSKVKKEEVNEADDKAYKYVVSQLKKKYGDGVLTTGEKMKPPTAAQKKAAAAHREKIAKQQAAEFKKDPSQGRYPKG